MRSALTVGVPAARGQIRGCGGWRWRRVRWGKPARGREGGNRFPQELGTNLAPWGGGKQPPAPLPPAPSGGNAARAPSPALQSGVRSPRSCCGSRAEPGTMRDVLGGTLWDSPVWEQVIGLGLDGMGFWGCFPVLNQSAPLLQVPSLIFGVGRGCWGICAHCWGGLVTPPPASLCTCSAATPTSLGPLSPSDAAGGSLGGDFKELLALAREQCVWEGVPAPRTQHPPPQPSLQLGARVWGTRGSPGAAEPGWPQVCWWQLGALGL